MSELIFYLSPVISLFIFGLIAIIIRSKAAKVRVAGFDYLWFNNLERKIQSRLRRLKVGSINPSAAQEALYTAAEKFVRKVKIEALRAQVWADKVLERIKAAKNHNQLSG